MFNTNNNKLLNVKINLVELERVRNILKTRSSINPK